jgi:capsular exopolysaccharide synthesis family protein
MNELTFRDYIKIFFRQKRVIFLFIFAVLVTVVVGLQLKTSQYAATVKLLITAQKQAEATYYRDMIDHQNIPPALTQSEIVKSTPVVERALQALFAYRPLADFLTYEKQFASPLKQYWIDRKGENFNERFQESDLDTEEKQAYLYRMALEDLKSRITVDPVRDTNIFTVTVTDYDSVGAAIAANIVSRSYIIFDLEQQLAEMQLKYGEKHLAVSQLQDNINAMIQNLNGKPLSNIEAIGPASVKIIEQASPPISPLGPPKRLVLLAGFVMSIVLGVALGFILEYMDHTFKSPQDVERTLGVPFLAGIPQKAKPAAYKDLAEHIYILMKEKGLKILVLTASRTGEGVTTISRNVGRYIASVMGHKVLVIEANPRDMSRRRFWRPRREQGLFDILEERIDLDAAVKDAGKNFFILPVGKTERNADTIPDSEKMRAIVEEAKKKYELILIDSASLNSSKDTIKLLNMAEAMTLVISEGHVRRYAVKSALESLNGRKVNILGAVLNKRVYPIPEFIYERV